MTTANRVRVAAEDLVRVQFGQTSASVAKSAGEDMRDWQLGSDRVDRRVKAAKKAVEEVKKQSSGGVEISVDDMRSRGKTGFVAEIVNGERKYLNADSQDKYGNSRVTKSFNLTKDGIYEINDANYGSSKQRKYFIKVIDGKEVDRSESIADLVVKEERDSLPDLDGSQKQVDWANSIREKFLLKLKNAGKPVPERMKTETSAKFYIDNREKLK